MSVEQKLFTVLSGLVSNRVFPDTAPYGTELPYITYTQIGGSVITPLNKSVPDKANSRMQITWWCDSRINSSILQDKIETAMRTSDEFSALPESAAISRSEQDLKLYGGNQDFSIWYVK